MMRLRMRFTLALLFLAPVAAAQTSVDETKAVKPDGLVEINNVSGSVRIIGWDKTEVHVTGTLEKNVERLDFDVRDGRTEIKVVLPKHAHNDTSAHLTIQVPAASQLEVETVSASVNVENLSEMESAPETISIRSVSGNVKTEARAQTVSLQTVSGDISFAGTADRMKGETVSGDVTCSGAISSLAAKTISGEVTAKGVQREAEISTVSGDAELDLETIRKAVLTSMSGDIDLEGALAEEGRINASTQSGDIMIRFAKEVSAEFEVSAISGNIKTELGGATSSVERTNFGRALRFSVGTGAGLVHLRTVSGDITLLR